MQTRATRKTAAPPLLALLLALLASACGLILTGSNDPAKVQAIMDSTHARGCIYARASATPWASATTVLVGTWGDPPPSLDECWKTLPPTMP
jgi:hypothetical protein